MMTGQSATKNYSRTAAIAVFVALLALYLLHETRGVTYAQDVAAFEASGLPEAEPPADLVVASIVQELARSPIHQDEAGMLLGQRITRGDAAQDLSPLAQSVADMGYRSTRAQQSLIQYGLQSEDVDLIFAQVDALLRRGKAVDQVLPILYAIETLPEGREMVAGKLIEGAPWRRVFFQSPLGLSNRSQLDSREQLLSLMIDQGEALGRQDIGAFLRRMVESGQRDRAYQFFCQIDTRCSDAGLIDSNFVVLSERMASTRPELYPFEWTANRGRGYSATPNSNTIGLSQAGVLLRWDGRGTPTFLSQVGPYSEFEQVNVSTADAQDFSANFYMEFRCPRSEAIRYVISPQADTDGLLFALPAQPTCAVGTFALVGRYRPQVSGVRVSVNSISSGANAERLRDETTS